MLFKVHENVIGRSPLVAMQVDWTYSPSLLVSVDSVSDASVGLS